MKKKRTAHTTEQITKTTIWQYILEYLYLKQVKFMINGIFRENTVVREEVAIVHWKMNSVKASHREQ